MKSKNAIASKFSFIFNNFKLLNNINAFTKNNTGKF